MKIIKVILALAVFALTINAHAGQMDRVKNSANATQELKQLKTFYELRNTMELIANTGHSNECKSAAILAHEKKDLEVKGDCSEQTLKAWEEQWQPKLEAHDTLFALATRIAFLQDNGLPLPYMKIGNTWKQANNKFMDMWRCSEASPNCAVRVQQGLNYANPYHTAWKKFGRWNLKPETPLVEEKVALEPEPEIAPEPEPEIIAEPEPEIVVEPEPTPATVAPVNATTLAEAMDMVYKDSNASNQCKSAVILLNVAAGGPGCSTLWKKGKNKWWNAINIGKDGTSFQERLNFLKAHSLPIPKHQITRETWRTPASAAQNRGVKINNRPPKDAWTYR